MGVWPDDLAADLHSSEGDTARFASLGVALRREEVEPDDVVWFGTVPLPWSRGDTRRSFAWDGDIDSAAADLADALWRLHPVDGQRLRRHLVAAFRTDDERATAVEANSRWNELLRRTVRWRPQPVDGAGSAWRRSRTPSDAAIASYRAALDPERRAMLWTTVVREFQGVERSTRRMLPLSLDREAQSPGSRSSVPWEARLRCC